MDPLSIQLKIIAKSLKGLTSGQRMERLLVLAALMLKHLDLAQIVSLRQELAGHADVPQQVLDLIDGHLALRDISSFHNRSPLGGRKARGGSQ
jgi:hypothetical protein